MALLEVVLGGIDQPKVSCEERGNTRLVYSTLSQKVLVRQQDTIVKKRHFFFLL